MGGLSLVPGGLKDLEKQCVVDSVCAEHNECMKSYQMTVYIMFQVPDVKVQDKLKLTMYH